jgi:hypothetical protein
MPEDILISAEDTTIFDLPYDLDLLTPEFKVKAIKEQRDNLELALCQDRTYLVLAAIHREDGRNSLNKISCKRGIPLGGYVYDATADSYTIACVDYMLLGYIPVSMAMRVSGQSHYQMRVPLAEAVVRRFLNPAQKKDVKNFRAVYKPENHRLEYIQMIDCNG